MAARDSIRWIAAMSTGRAAWIALALTGVLLEGCALFFQYVLGLQPRVMCVYIRLAVVGLVAAGLVGAIAPARPAVQFLGFAGWGVAAGQGLSLSRELTAIQAAGPYSLEVSCSFLPKFPDAAPSHRFRQSPNTSPPSGSSVIAR